MDQIKEVLCPSCGKVLYQTGPVDTAESVFGKARINPIVRHEQGDFMRCAHCAKWVLLARIDRAGTVGFEIHPSRRYLDALPEA
jgi:phage FluMu protein Com